MLRNKVCSTYLKLAVGMVTNIFHFLEKSSSNKGQIWLHQFHSEHPPFFVKNNVSFTI